ncbi:coiled-coil-helix-coiled-coil-helix domain-containing protein 5 isoform X6 [Carcharodon carcharias]|uniref:coiled-coil-helix-coiled-coil-helix domain-containing protein 5 isoform X6 n=1 Tax=Carcharodon carcharias TaxID=13397 RepID=UPI001B7F4344|nr:coiled-coil-helix-coiled-coil-helix domain-containing protein 5 isoform X6 [Carcharodon carcharias]
MRRRGGAIVFLHHWPCWGRESRARQAAFEITARYCSKEMEDYGQCVASNPASWQKDCHQLKTSVAQCTSSQVYMLHIMCSEGFTEIKRLDSH